MNVTLSWDLFIIVFFGLVIAYSFIIGKHESIKVIIATYISIVAVEGIGNLLQRVTGQSESILNVLGFSVDLTVLMSAKLVFFVAIIIFLAIRGGLNIEYGKEMNTIINIIITGLFGFATAGLLMSALITLIGEPAQLAAQSVDQSSALSSIAQQSKLIQAIVLNQDLWLSLPALLLIGVGIISYAEEDE